jgi:hypothetical protein
MAPKTQAALVAEALSADWDAEKLHAALDEQARRKQT